MFLSTDTRGEDASLLRVHYLCATPNICTYLSRVHKGRSGVVEEGIDGVTTLHGCAARERIFADKPSPRTSSSNCAQNVRCPLPAQNLNTDHSRTLASLKSPPSSPPPAPALPSPLPNSCFLQIRFAQASTLAHTLARAHSLHCCGQGP